MSMIFGVPMAVLSGQLLIGIINGAFYAKEEAKISVFDHGLLYGDGVFEGLRSYGGKVVRVPVPADISTDGILSRIGSQ